MVVVVELAEAFLLVEAVELRGDDDGGGLVGGACELGRKLQSRRALSVAEASGHDVQVGARGEELGRGVVPELPSERAGDADPAGVPAVPAGHRVGVPRLAANRVGRERECVLGHLDGKSRSGLSALPSRLPSTVFQLRSGQQARLADQKLVLCGG
jgi:hypothetical protein